MHYTGVYPHPTPPPLSKSACWPRDDGNSQDNNSQVQNSLRTQADTAIWAQVGPMNAS